MPLSIPVSIPFSIEIFFAIIPAIILFVYGIDNFGKEMQRSLGKQFTSLIKWATNTKVNSILFGAILTILVQTSSATTLISMGLVNSGLITFVQSMSIIIGAKIGSTLISQLIAFNLMIYAPIIIIFGFLLSLLKNKYSVLGKPIFYFGIVLFSLNLISINIIPLKTNPLLLSLLSKTSFVPIGIIAGFLVTTLFQSSSVTIGLTVILAQNNLFGLQEAIPIILGAHIGTSLLPLIVSSRMDVFAKRTAVTYALSNIASVIVTLPIFGIVIFIIEQIGGNLGQQVANAHLLTSLLTVVFLIIFFNQFKKLIEKIVSTKETEIVLKTKHLIGLENKKKNIVFNSVQNELKHSFESISILFNEIKVLLFSIDEKNSPRIFKLSALIKLIHSEIKNVLIKLFKKPDKKESEQIILFVRTSTLCEQISTSSQKLAEIIIQTKENKIVFSNYGKSVIDECLTKLCKNMLLIKKNYPNFDEKTSLEMSKTGKELRNIINKGYDEYLEQLAEEKSVVGGIFVEALSTIQDIESNIREIRKICEK